jgi:hypothetical protein
VARFASLGAEFWLGCSLNTDIQLCVRTGEPKPFTSDLQRFFVPSFACVVECADSSVTTLRRLLRDVQAFAIS